MRKVSCEYGVPKVFVGIGLKKKRKEKEIKKLDLIFRFSRIFGESRTFDLEYLEI